MKNFQAKRTLAIGILLLLCATGLFPALQANNTNTTITATLHLSVPTTSIKNGDIRISLSEATDIIPSFGKPQLPVVTQTYEFPVGTQIQTVTFTPGPLQTLTTSVPVQPVPTPQKIGDSLIPQNIKDETVYSSTDPYPATWGWYTLGAGLNANNQHVLFLALHCSPIHYRPALNQIQYTTDLSITISYELPPAKAPVTTVYSLAIIAPQEYAAALQPLVDHKNASMLPTQFVSLEYIASTYEGRDLPEQMKYFIADAIESWNTTYVLLVGDMKKTPIRTTYANWWETDILSDLYYADIYNASGGFCSWDRNKNNKFGETDHDEHDIDGVDLYADINLGRLACVNISDVQNVVAKIIAYETKTYGQDWFKKIILAGGDTFPRGMGAPRNVFEGEITNVAVAEQLPSFAPTYLWTSKRNLHFYTFNRAIDKGAGFLSYAGHGFEHGWGTYRPNSISNIAIMYYTPLINRLSNNDKLPIMFWDACLTAKLDFNITDLHYYPKLMAVLIGSGRISNDTSINFPSFAWYFVRKQTGGAIATVGSTRTAYTHVDETGIYGGAGYLDVEFFASYHDGVRLGQMMTGAQNAYINGAGKDYFTLEEFILLGDPSLMVGGLSS